MKETINTIQSTKKSLNGSGYRASDIESTVEDVASDFSSSAMERLRSFDVPALINTVGEGISSGAQSSYEFAKKYRYQILAGVAAAGAVAVAYKMMGKKSLKLALPTSLGLVGKTAKKSKAKSKKK